MTNLNKIRTTRKLSFRKLGGMSGVHFVTLARIEAGVHDPRLSTLRRLAKALNVSIGKLVGDYPPTTKRRPYGTHQTKGRMVRRVSRAG
ncbi:MAG: helix-turn-helix transcriptional regulator [Nitrospinae bacterium]|nr:helix-turn-helix transcriptional regulator [Nitrospinota bacterium]